MGFDLDHLSLEVCEVMEDGGGHAFIDGVCEKAGLLTVEENRSHPATESVPGCESACHMMDLLVMWRTAGWEEGVPNCGGGRAQNLKTLLTHTALSLSWRETIKAN